MLPRQLRQRLRHGFVREAAMNLVGAQCLRNILDGQLTDLRKLVEKGL